MKNFRIKLLVLLLTSSMILSACSFSNNNVTNNTSQIGESSVVYLEYDNKDEDISSTESSINILLNNDTIVCDSSNVSIEGSIATIKSAGNYSISGTLTDGQIIVDCADTDKVTIILNGVDISCSTTSPIYVINADKTIITLADNTQNIITDSRNAKTNEDNDSDIPGSAIFSKDDLTINGNGSLTVTGNYNNGIVCKNDLKISGGNLTVNALNNGIKGNDTVTIKNNVSINISCDGDGIKTDYVVDDTSSGKEKGYIYIESGNLTIQSIDDCIKADTYIIIDDGNFNLTSNGGYTNATSHSDSMEDINFPNGKEFNRGDMGDISMPNGEEFNHGDMGDISMPNGEEFNHGDMGDISMPNGGKFNRGDMGDIPMPNGEEFNRDDMGDMAIPNGGKFNRGDMGDIPMPNGEEFNRDDMDDMAISNGETFNPSDMQTFSTDENTTSTETTLKSKTISADGDITINNGTFTLNSSDDSVHSNANIIINGGTFNINAGGKGIHSDYDCTINDGTIEIQNSYEGIEGTNIYVNGGNLNITSSDDGFNASDNTETASGNNGFNVSSNAYLEFNGGYTYVNANGDGLDSNGDMKFNGGIVIVEGPTTSADGPLDCGDSNNIITIDGGTLIAGGAVGMFEIPDTTSTQNVIYSVSTSAKAGDIIVLADDNNNVVCAMKSTKDMSGIIFSSANIETGKTYHIYVNPTYDGSFDEYGFAEGGTCSNGTDVGSVEVTSTVSPIGIGSVMSGGFGGHGNKPF